MTSSDTTPDFEAAERPDWSDSLMELAHDTIAAEGDIDGEDVVTLARAFLALRAEMERLREEAHHWHEERNDLGVLSDELAQQVERLTREREDAVRVAKYESGVAAQAVAALAALREDKAWLVSALEEIRDSDDPRWYDHCNAALDAARAQTTGGRSDG